MAFREQFYSPELEDDQQAAVLYSPFREKSLNPHSWNRKLKFWENLLSDTALERRLITFDSQALPKMFERKGITPKCLETVIEELTKTGKLRSIEHYKTTNSWLTWGFDKLVKQPIVWGVNQLIGPSKSKSSVYVWPEVVKLLSDQIIEEHEKNIYIGLGCNLMSISDFRKSYLNLIPNDQDFEIVMTQMIQDQKIYVTETKEKEKLVKFCKKGEKAVLLISDLEIQVYQIQKTADKLNKEIGKYSSEIESFLEEARRHIKEGSKFKAKQCLKKKNAIMKIIEKKSTTLENLQIILEKIEDAKTNDMVVKACEAGALALTTINSENSLDKAEAVMEEVQDAMESHDDIVNMISSFNLSEDNNDELEQELENLLEEEENRNLVDKKEHLDALPDVPTFVPSNEYRNKKPEIKSLPVKHASTS